MHNATINYIWFTLVRTVNIFNLKKYFSISILTFLLLGIIFNFLFTFYSHILTTYTMALIYSWTIFHLIVFLMWLSINLIKHKIIKNILKTAIEFYFMIYLFVIYYKISAYFINDYINNKISSSDFVLLGSGTNKHSLLEATTNSTLYFIMLNNILLIFLSLFIKEILILISEEIDVSPRLFFEKNTIKEMNYSLTVSNLKFPLFKIIYFSDNMKNEILTIVKSNNIIIKYTNILVFIALYIYVTYFIYISYQPYFK